MGKVLVKPDAEKDFYIIWSSEVDAPVAFGSRKSLQHEDQTFTDRHFERADERSSSSWVFPETWDTDFTMNFQGAGTIRRSQMIELCRRIDKIWDDLYGWHTYPQIQELIEPFEDDDDDNS